MLQPQYSHAFDEALLHHDTLNLHKSQHSRRWACPMTRLQHIMQALKAGSALSQSAPAVFLKPWQ